MKTLPNQALVRESTQEENIKLSSVKMNTTTSDDFDAKFDKVWNVIFNTFYDAVYDAFYGVIFNSTFDKTFHGKYGAEFDARFDAEFNERFDEIFDELFEENFNEIFEENFDEIWDAEQLSALEESAERIDNARGLEATRAASEDFLRCLKAAFPAIVKKLKNG